jgi:hypothetical protein
MTETIETETIQIRRKTWLKLPDAIIAATAIAIGADGTASYLTARNTEPGCFS